MDIDPRLDPESSVPIPRWRGRLHAIMFFITLPAGIVLLALAHGASEWIAAGIYVLTLVGLYASSAAYHRIRWSERARARMRLLDHSMIYLLIAGTYTPFGVLALDGWWRIGMLAGVWAGALFGVAMKFLGIEKMRKLGGTLYIGLGWIVIVAFPKIVDGLTTPALILLILGGLLYTGGAVVLLRRRPDPSPLVFGYHEVWHSFVAGATACHYAAILLLVRAAA
jgi:hemolysin III